MLFVLCYYHYHAKNVIQTIKNFCSYSFERNILNDP